MVVDDIHGSRWDVVLRGGWHALESYEGDVFRWARNNALILVSTFEAQRQRVSFDLEPGPSVTARPFQLLVFDASGARIFDETFAGRRTASLDVAMTKPTVHVLRLFAPGGGNVRGLDVRALDFRVFRIAVETLYDVVPAASGYEVGTGWYPLESFGGENYRWVDNDARLVVWEDTETPLELELEPGPGVGYRPFALTVLGERGEVVASTMVSGRERVAVPVGGGHARPRQLTLHIEAGGEASPGDGRALNFRAFCVRP